jgi:ABC-type glycerol-3-phosphate transport system substrate-binding protein
MLAEGHRKNLLEKDIRMKDASECNFKHNNALKRMLGVSPALILLLLAGCPSPHRTPGPKQATQPFRGSELAVVAPRSLNLPAYWEVMLQEWSSQTGASTKFVEFDNADPFLTESVMNPESGGRLILFPFRDFCRFESQLTPLSAFDARLESREIFKGLRQRSLSREREFMAVPVSVPVLVCYYRNDLLRAARRKAPETWNDYLELIETLDTWGPGLSAVEPLSPEFRATTFFAKSLAFCKHPENYSVWFDIDTAKPTLNSPGFLEALETARRTWSKLPPEVATYSPADCRRMLLTGKAAMALAFEPQSAELIARSQSEESSKVERIEGIEIGVCRLPGSRRVFNRNSKKWDTIAAGTIHAPALCGFAGLAVGVTLPAKREQDSAALDLLVNLSTSTLFDEAFASLPKGPCRESQSSLAPSWFGPELSSEEASQYADAVAQSLRDMQLVHELPVIGAEEFRQATAAALDPFIRGEADSEQTSQAMQHAFELIVERLGPDVVRDSHRRGLGLSPQTKK